MKYRNEIGVLLTAALMLFSLVYAGANESISYGGQAIGAEASGFDALAFQVFGGVSAPESNERLAASDRSPFMQGVISK